MKRFGNIYKDICSFENLLKAAKQAYKGKRFRDDGTSFHFNLERNLFELNSELKLKTYKPVQGSNSRKLS